MRQEEFNEIFRNRTKKLALEVINVVGDLKYSDAKGVLRKQLIRSVTSSAANFRAICRARSEREWYAKLYIVVEEADESFFWMEMKVVSGLVSQKRIAWCYNGSQEILNSVSV